MDGILKVILSGHKMLHFYSNGFARIVSLQHGNLDAMGI